MANIQLGEKTIEVKEVSPLAAAKIACLVYPHLNKVTLNLLDSGKELLLANLFTELSQIPEAPELSLRVFCCLIDQDFDWVINNATSQQIFEALMTISEVNLGLLDFFYEVITGLLPLRVVNGI